MFKKLIKIPFIFILSVILLLNQTIITNSKTNNTTIIDISSEQIEQEQIKQITSSFENTKLDEYIYDWRPVDKITTIKKEVGYAANQPANGTVFSSNGGFYWQDGGYNTNISLNISYGIFSISVSKGSVAPTGLWITSPYINTPVKLYIHKDIITTKYAVYRKLKYGGEWTYHSTQYTHTPTRNYLTVYRV